MTWTSFNVRVRDEEAAAFRLVARYRGFPSVGAWLASVGAPEAKRHRKGARRWKEAEAARRASGLAWQRGRFAASTPQGAGVVDGEVEGILASPFGIFRQEKRYTLVHLPTGRHLLSLSRRKDCQEVAEELLAQEVAWHESDPYKVMTGPGVDAVRAIAARAQASSISKMGNNILDSVAGRGYTTPMDTPVAVPRTLLEAVRYFADPDTSLNFMVALRWPNGVACPTCGRTDVRFIATRRLWECKDKHPRKQFSIKVGTIFEDSPLGMDKWLPVVWLVANCKNGISSYEVARDLGVTQKTAWFMLQRVRVAMETGSYQKLSGEIEADETFIGGLAKNMHKKVREAKIKGRGPQDKTAVMGVLQRDGEVRAFVVPDRKKPTVQAKIRENVTPGSEVFTDALRSYEGLTPEYAHEAVDHAECYVRGNVHTNGLENFWSLLKRTLGGTYVAVAPFHLHRYVNEQVFRYNARKGTDGGRFLAVAAGTIGKRLTYKDLIAANEEKTDAHTTREGARGRAT